MFRKKAKVKKDNPFNEKIIFPGHPVSELTVIAGMVIF